MADIEYVKDIPDNFQFLSDSQDVEQIKSDIPGADEFDSFFVSIQDGDYLDIYGIKGIIPYNNKPVYKLR
jgi:hypothetical protein